MGKPLRRSEAHKLCKMFGNTRCACEERGDKRPCISIANYLRGGDGTAESAMAAYQRVRSLYARALPGPGGERT